MSFLNFNTTEIMFVMSCLVFCTENCILLNFVSFEIWKEGFLLLLFCLFVLLFCFVLFLTYTNYITMRMIFLLYHE